MQVYLSRPHIVNSVFNNNSARCRTAIDGQALGGAIHLSHGGAVINGSHFRGNEVGPKGYGHIIYSEYFLAGHDVMVEIDDSVFDGQAGPPPTGVTQVDCATIYDITFVVGVIDVRNSVFKKTSLFVGNCAIDRVDGTLKQASSKGGASNNASSTGDDQGSKNATMLSLTLTNNKNYGMQFYSVSFNVTLGSNTSWAHALLHGTSINQDTIVPTLALLPDARAITITGTDTFDLDDTPEVRSPDAFEGALVMVNVAVACKCRTINSLIVCGSQCRYDDINCWLDNGRVKPVDLMGNVILADQIFLDGCNARVLEHAKLVGFPPSPPYDCRNTPNGPAVSSSNSLRSATRTAVTPTITPRAAANIKNNLHSVATSSIPARIEQATLPPANVFLVHGAWVHITRNATIEVVDSTLEGEAQDASFISCNSSFGTCQQSYYTVRIAPLGLRNDGTLSLSTSAALTLYGTNYEQTDNGLLDLGINSKRQCSWYFPHLAVTHGHMHLPSTPSFLKVSLGDITTVQIGYPYAVLLSNNPISGGRVGTHLYPSSNAWFGLSYQQTMNVSYQFSLDPRKVGCERIDLQQTFNDSSPKCSYCFSKLSRSPYQCTWLTKDLRCVAKSNKSELCQQQTPTHKNSWYQSVLNQSNNDFSGQCRDTCCAHDCYGHGTCNDETHRCSCGMLYKSSDCQLADTQLVMAMTIIGLTSFFAVLTAIMASAIYNRSQRLSLEKRRSNDASLDFEGFRHMLLGPVDESHTPAEVTRHKRLQEDLLLQSVSVDFKDIRFHEQVGSGAFGVVYKGTWRKTDCAIKMVRRQPWRHRKSGGSGPAEFDFSADELDMMRSEALLMTQLKHPNIVLTMGIAFRNVDTTGQSMVCIITEYAARGSLADVLSKPHHISVPLRIRFALDAAKGMLFLHTHSPPIVHRDLKSKNLLVDDRNTVKVCDFGNSTFCDPDGIATRQRNGHTLSAFRYISGSFDENNEGNLYNTQYSGISTSTGNSSRTNSGNSRKLRDNQILDESRRSHLYIDTDADESKTTSFTNSPTTHMMTTQKGTMQWTAPELMKSQARVAFHTLHDVLSVDVYSFGIVMWELLTRKPPFESESAKSPWSVRDAVLAGRRPPIPDGHNEQYCNLMKRCWSQNPKKRPLFGDVVSMIIAIQKVVQHDTAEARRSARFSRMGEYNTKDTSDNPTTLDIPSTPITTGAAAADNDTWISPPSTDVPEALTVSDTEDSCENEDDPEYSTPARHVQRAPAVLPTPERCEHEERLSEPSSQNKFSQRNSVGRI